MSFPIQNFTNSKKDLKFTACHACDTEFLVPCEEKVREINPSFKKKKDSCHSADCKEIFCLVLKRRDSEKWEDMEFIGLDEQPLSVVENMGFQRMTLSYVAPQYKYLMHFSCNFTGFINFGTSVLSF